MGLSILLVSSLWTISTVELVLTGVFTHGTIIEIKGGYDGAFYPVFKYQTEEGTWYRETGVGSSHPLYPIYAVYSVGKRVPVIYDPDNPTTAGINTFMQLWLFPILVNLFGVYVAKSVFRKGLDKEIDSDQS